MTKWGWIYVIAYTAIVIIAIIAAIVKFMAYWKIAFM